MHVGASLSNKVSFSRIIPNTFRRRTDIMRNGFSTKGKNINVEQFRLQERGLEIMLYLSMQ